MIRLCLTIVILGALLSGGCSLRPEIPVTRDILMRTRIYTTYVIDESPEEVVDALNKDGEAILAVKRSIRGKDFLMHLKILATSGGLQVFEYDR